MAREPDTTDHDYPAGYMAPALATSTLTQLCESDAAFRADLPGLLTTHPGAWVVYHSAKRLGAFNSKPDAFRACAAHGLSHDECLIDVIEPLVAEEHIGPGSSGQTATVV